MNELHVDYVYEFNRLLESPCSNSADICIFFWIFYGAASIYSTCKLMILCALSFDTISNTFLYITSGNTSNPSIWNSEEQFCFLFFFNLDLSAGRCLKIHALP